MLDFPKLHGLSPLAELTNYSDYLLANSSWLRVAALVGFVFTVLSVLSYWRSKSPIWIRCLGILLRCLGVGTLLLCLLEPMATLERPKPQSNIFAIMVDRSKSVDVLLREMNAQGDHSINDLLPDSTAWQRKLAEDFRVRHYLFDSTLEPTDTLENIRFEGNESSMYGSLKSLKERFSGRPLAGVLLISDGHATDTMLKELGPELGFPVYPVRLGKLRSQKDVRIESVSLNQSNFETSPCTIQAKVMHQGFGGESVVVDLVDSLGTVVQSQTLPLKSESEPVIAEFRFRPSQPGVQGYRIVTRTKLEHGQQISPQPQEGAKEAVAEQANRTTSELTLENNSRFQVVDRGRGPYRILYVAGRPNWEHKFLKRALEEDDEIRLTSLVRIAKKELKFSFRDSNVDSSNPLFSGFEDALPEEKEQYDEPVFARLGLSSAGELKKGFPKDAEELFEYSALIVDDLEHDFFTPDQQSMIRQFVVSRGGGLLALGGQESMRGKGFRNSVLSQVLPIYGDEDSARSASSEDFDLSDSPAIRYSLSREGWLQPFLRTADGEVAEKARIAAMPSFEVLNRVQGVKPGATVLAEAVVSSDTKTPVLVTQRFGKGRTAAFLIGDLWRWGLHHEGKDPSPLYQSWRQMVRWLISDVPKKIQMKMDETNGASRIAHVLVDVKGTDFRSIDNAQVALKIVSPSGKESTATAESSSKTAGQYELTFVAEEEGVFSVTGEVTAPDGTAIGTAQLGWIYEPTAREISEIGENTAVLEQLARETNGEMVAASDLEAFVESLPSRKVPVTEIKIVPLWHQSWIMLISLTCFCGEWGLRRRNGLA